MNNVVLSLNFFFHIRLDQGSFCGVTDNPYWSFVWKTLLGGSPKPHHDLHFVVLCVICWFTHVNQQFTWFTCVNWQFTWFTCVNQQFTCVNWRFTHRQRLSLHSRSLESYKADYTCKCGWIDIASARASAIEVYMCKPVVHTCKLAVYTQTKTVLTFQIVGIVQGRLHV